MACSGILIWKWSYEVFNEFLMKKCNNILCQSNDNPKRTAFFCLSSDNNNILFLCEKWSNKVTNDIDLWKLQTMKVNSDLCTLSACAWYAWWKLAWWWIDCRTMGNRTIGNLNRQTNNLAAKMEYLFHFSIH